MRNIDNDTVFLYIQTYDVEEESLIRMLESVRKQTYENYVCFLYDNCSKKESIHEIIERYSLLDRRFQIRKIFDNSGMVIMWNYAIPEIIELSKGKGYFSAIDADDELELDALEIMVSEIKTANADMVCGGACFIDAGSGEIIRERAPEEKYIIEGKDFGERFPEYYQIMRTHWAKMMRMSIVEKLRLNHIPKISYGKDTLLIREALFQSQRVVLIPNIVYRYFMYRVTKSYNIGASRIESPRCLYLNDLHFLFQKVGYVSAENMNYLLGSYMMETKETIMLVRKWTCSLKEKIDYLYPMLTNEENKSIYRVLYGEVYTEFGEWIVSQMFCVDEETIRKTCEMLGIMGFVPYRLPQYDDGIFYRVLIEIDKFLVKGELKKQLRNILLNLVSANGILKGLDEYFLVKYSDMVIEVLNGSYEKAVSLIKEYISKPYGFMGLSKGELSEIGLTLSSLLQNDNDFVYFKKYQIRHYIDTDIQKAKEELDDWIQILPEDVEIRELRNLVSAD